MIKIEDVDVEKSPNDLKEYRVCTLENGLRVLLVMDPQGSPGDDGVAAAGLCLGVGSFSEPDSLPGLAHFLEHMVFMGSQTHPEENGYDKFIKQHGGCSNAHTEVERTIFYFDVQCAYLKPALERFSQFFISPLLHRESMESELNLVHAEWAMSVHIEKHRFELLMGSMAKDGHPMRKFCWGNGTSLETTPKSEGIDVHECLDKFRKKFYMAQYMTVAVLSREPLDVLQSWVSEYFKDIPSSTEEKPTFGHLGKPFDTPSFRKLYQIIPAKNAQAVVLTWAFPTLQDCYRKKPLHYLGFLVGHEGEGSVLSLLKRRKWARGIRSGNSEDGYEHNSTWASFKVTVTLTDAGLANMIEVITVIFQYFNILRQEGPQERIWAEQLRIERNEFQWLEPQDPQDYVHRLAVDMQKYQPCDYITGGRMTKEFDAQLISTCLAQLLPQRMNISVWSKTFANKPAAECRKEQWYQTSYFVEEIRAEWIRKWAECGTNAELHLPKENVFIAEDFTLKTEDRIYETLERPFKTSPTTRLWYKKDVDFRIPKGFVKFSLISLEADKTVERACLTDLYSLALRRTVSEVLYPAEMAHLSYTVNSCDRGITVDVNGFNDKLPLLFRTLVDCMGNLEVNESLFSVVQQELVYVYDYMSFCPERLNSQLRKAILQSKAHTMLQKKECLGSLTVQKLTDFVGRFYTAAYVEGLVQGNLTAKEVEELEQYLVSSLNISAPEDQDALHRMYVTKLPIGNSRFAIMNQNQNDENSVITNFYEHGSSTLHEQVLNDLMLSNMEEPCFSQLRTKMQLGYAVQTNPRNLFGVLGYSITVSSQASRFSMQLLDEHIETFLEYYNDTCIQKMTEDKFASFVATVIKQKNCDDTNLCEEVRRHWFEIINQDYLFDRPTEEIKELKTVTLDELKVWSKNLVGDHKNRRKLSIQVTGHKRAEQVAGRRKKVARRQKSGAASTKNYREITSIDEFQAEFGFYEFKRS